MFCYCAPKHNRRRSFPAMQKYRRRNIGHDDTKKNDRMALIRTNCTCCFNECHTAKCYSNKNPYAKCHSPECHSARWHSGQCCGAKIYARFSPFASWRNGPSVQKLFCGCNLQMFVISYSVCPCQAFLILVIEASSPPATYRCST
jgi:hypothetical protein